jgi:hypothetical protein
MMMELLLERKYIKPEYCIGRLYINGEFFCNTLEDTIRDINKNGTFDCGEFKISGHTAIPYGTYEIQVTYSPKFKRELPLLLDVPSFTGIRIHRGNTNKDSSGCILVGENTKKGMVLNSTKYEEELTKLLKDTQNKKEKIIITII